MITREDVEELAGLARLRLGAAQAHRRPAARGGALQSSLPPGKRWKPLDTPGGEPMTHAVPLDCPLREDAAAPSLSADEALAAAPARVDDFFVVPRIIEK